MGKDDWFCVSDLRLFGPKECMHKITEKRVSKTGVFSE